MKIYTERCTTAQKLTVPIYKILDKWLVGKKSSDSALYSEKWKQEFTSRPTWCDADMALQQINQGTATGNRLALYLRSFFQSLLFTLGSFVQNWAWSVVIIGLSVYFICALGLQYVHIETDLIKLWVSQGGRLDEELHFLQRVQQNYKYNVVREKRSADLEKSGIQESFVSIKPRNNRKDEESLDASLDNAFDSRFQVVIQTPATKGTNALTKESLLKHVQIIEEIANFQVEMYGENWTLADICFKPPSPKLSHGPLAGVMSKLLDRLIPCIWITPIDCFWEGSKPLGPSPPLTLGPDIHAFITSLPKGNITWKNLDPLSVLKEVSTLFDLGTIFNFFERAGIGAAYLDRWCIDPLDPECPATAPNAFDHCLAFKKFQAWNMAMPKNKQIELEAETISTDKAKLQDDALQIFENIFGKRRRKREIMSSTIKPNSKNHTEDESSDYYAYDDDNDYSINQNATKTKEELAEEEQCLRYGKSFLKWLNENEHRWSEFLTLDEMPVYPDYGKIMTGGCRGFARNTMVWPEDLIIGGIKRQNHKLISAEAFQSIFLVASDNDVFSRYKMQKSDLKPNLNVDSWNPYYASQIVSAWQRNFTQHIYEHRWNTEINRQIHPLSATSLEDMLKEFSQFKFLVIFVGYFLMFVYAGWSQLNWDGWWFAVNSSVGLSILGVFLVTYASISGLGASSYMGIHCNAATTQIVPFLTLGLGVDDMFLLLHNYKDVHHTVKNNEIGILMKETGMSVVITSINNIIAFMAGTLLPIPALKSFCSQTAILLTFNMIAIMVIYPAMIALDLRRRRASRRDMGCCCMGNSLRVESLELNMGKQIVGSLSVTGHNVYPGPPPSLLLKNDDDKEKKWYTLGGFLQYYYIPFLTLPLTKLMVIVTCISVLLISCFGLYQSSLGLELSDVLPEGTPPAAFLRAREKYFSFYPMFAVLKGSRINFAKQQEQIEQYRLDIAKSRYVIKVNGRPSEEYWLSMMRTWLSSIQKHLDNAIKKGDINAVTGEMKADTKITDEAKIARRLVCSYGNKYNCTGRISTIKLVNDAGVINADGFYNYLTAWYNIDNMMYYVSQASFYPVPPSWSFTTHEKVVPPALPPAYSQIPFYLIDLIDTPVIVKMIREIRSVCDRYTELGLPNFPSGVAFIFWEQYLSLRWNLFIAICVISSAVFIVISVVIFNPWAAMMVIIVVISMTIELAGFMGATGVKLNPVSAVTLVAAVGIGVEFTVHVVLVYLTSLGSKDERMAACLNHMFIPVIHGGLSTLLGILMLAFSEFDFIVKYFFIVLSALILIGLINGLVLLPVLLSLIGPPCEIRLFDEKTYLPVPASLCKQKNRDPSDKQTDDLVKRRVGGAFVEIQVNGSMGTDAEDNYTHHNSSSVIAKDSLQNNQFYWNSPSLANKNTEYISVPASTLSTGQHHKVNVKNAPSKIPISTVGPQHSTSPLLSSSSSSNATSKKRNNDGNSKLFKFSSNALRF
ncbi:Patched family protein [Brugia malayi]|uniref:BMA-PTC-3, isoform b n=1 Tax=Brugia malayi TaxID=6279 RepID=A0A4E9FA97_BRUMA|nr:Patched family protein [Brugia malayi]VIO93291.1 Patched family protein [Brugia malayi]